jgi:hypothetical protein
MDNLQAIHRVGPVIGDKLQKAGYTSRAQVASATSEEINEKIGLVVGRANRIIESAKMAIKPEQIAPPKPGSQAVEVSDDSPESGDTRQLARQFAEVILQNPDVTQQIAQETNSELAKIFGKKLRKKVAKKVLSKKKFRKALMSRLSEH